MHWLKDFPPLLSTDLGSSALVRTSEQCTMRGSLAGEVVQCQRRCDEALVLIGWE